MTISNFATFNYNMQLRNIPTNIYMYIPTNI